MTMLAQHEWPEANRKRIREDEYADVASGGTLGFTEHRSVGALPFFSFPVVPPGLSYRSVLPAA